MVISLLGAGNLATQLGYALRKAGYAILDVYSRTNEAAVTLAERLGARPVTDPGDLKNEADLFICALKDDALELVLPRLNLTNPLLVHTAGSVPMRLLSAYTNRYGVLYPLQAFSKDKPVDFKQIPLFVEGCNTEVLSTLVSLAKNLSERVIPLSSDKRMALHLSAVFAGNFVNHLYVIAEELLREQQLSFDYLYPLIEETTSKLKNARPIETQTGPAVRRDVFTLAQHQSLLENKPDWQKIYSLISHSIYKTHHNDEL